MELLAPRIAAKALAGQFVILRVAELGERVPLTIADYNWQAGTVTVIFQIVGGSTQKLNEKEHDDQIKRI